MGYRRVEATTEQMFALRAEGKSNAQIAAELGCSVMTVFNRIGGQKKYKPRAERAREEMEQAQ